VIVEQNVARRRFIQSREAPYSFIEVTADYIPEARNADATLWNDRSYDGLRATDGTDISSRTKHREYMKKHGLTTADDFKNTWDKAAEQRAAYYTEGPRKEVRQDLLRTIEQLQNRRK
jgi:hypothetical protein